MSRNGEDAPEPAGGWLDGDQQRAWLATCGLSVADRRVTEVTLTDSGRQALEAAAPGHVDLVRRLFFEARHQGNRLRRPGPPAASR